MSKRKTNPTLARALAPEDVRRGLYVAVLAEVWQFVLVPCDSALSHRPAVHDVALRPWLDAVEPLKVVDVCMPFAAARRPDRTTTVLDLRRLRLARLDDGFARRTRRLMRSRRASMP